MAWCSQAKCDVTSMRWRVVTRVVLVGALLLGLAGIAGGDFVTPAQASTPTICPDGSTRCPFVSAVTGSRVSKTQLSKFLLRIFAAKFKTDGPLGAYELQRCENPGSAPFHIKCVLWSTASRHDLSSLKAVFLASRLFASVKTWFP